MNTTQTAPLPLYDARQWHMEARSRLLRLRRTEAPDSAALREAREELAKAQDAVCDAVACLSGRGDAKGDSDVPLVF